MSQSAPPADWSGLKRWIQEHYPQVRSIDPLTLAELMALPVGTPDPADDTRVNTLAAGVTPRLILIDIRAAHEQAVSSLPGAHGVQSVDEGLAYVKSTDAAGATVVTCCSAGVRSARLCDVLCSAGYENVFNLDGGLFTWARLGLPLRCGNEVVQRVHPFDDHWAALLPVHLRAPMSPAG